AQALWPSVSFWHSVRPSSRKNRRKNVVAQNPEAANSCVSGRNRLVEPVVRPTILTHRSSHVENLVSNAEKHSKPKAETGTPPLCRAPRGPHATVRGCGPALE